jgi:hypothetical protein
MEEAANLLKRKAQVQEDNVRSHVSIYLMEADLLKRKAQVQEDKCQKHMTLRKKKCDEMGQEFL